jgi:hypothetical protein
VVVDEIVSDPRSRLPRRSVSAMRASLTNSTRGFAAGSNCLNNSCEPQVRHVAVEKLDIATASDESGTYTCELDAVPRRSHFDHGEDVVETEQVRRVSGVEVEAVRRRGRSDQEIGDAHPT